MNASAERQVGTRYGGRYKKVTKKSAGRARRAWDAYDPDCPSRGVLDRIADKWTVLVVGTLARGTHRFGELRTEVAGISQKVLTDILRGLERDGTVTRKVYASVPPRVEYSLTPLGRSLAGLLGSVRLWAESNVESVLGARRAYDRRRPGV